MVKWSLHRSRPELSGDTVTVRHEIAPINLEPCRSVAKVEVKNHDDALVAVTDHIPRRLPNN